MGPKGVLICLKNFYYITPRIDLSHFKRKFVCMPRVEITLYVFIKGRCYIYRYNMVAVVLKYAAWSVDPRASAQGGGRLLM